MFRILAHEIHEITRKQKTRLEELFLPANHANRRESKITVRGGVAFRLKEANSFPYKAPLRFP